MSYSEDHYKTISTIAQSLFKDRGSKFIGYLFPTSSEDTFKQQLELIKANEQTARHHCWAFRIGEEEVIERSNDDGEPSHSAGTPILRQLQSSEIVNVGCVVVRYFGGVKLGVPGLIHAYGTAAKFCIDQVSIDVMRIERFISLEFGYEQISFVESTARKLELEIVERNQSLHISYKIAVARSKLQETIHAFEKNHLVRVHPN